VGLKAWGRVSVFASRSRLAFRSLIETAATNVNTKEAIKKQSWAVLSFAQAKTQRLIQAKYQSEFRGEHFVDMRTREMNTSGPKRKIPNTTKGFSPPPRAAQKRSHEQISAREKCFMGNSPGAWRLGAFVFRWDVIFPFV